MVLYPQLSVEVFELATVKLSSIIRDDYFWDSKPANDAFPNEFFYFGLCDPFCEIVNSNNQKFNLFLTSWQWSDDVNPLC